MDGSETILGHDTVTEKRDAEVILRMLQWLELQTAGIDAPRTARLIRQSASVFAEETAVNRHVM